MPVELIIFGALLLAGLIPSLTIARSAVARVGWLLLATGLIAGGGFVQRARHDREVR